MLKTRLFIVALVAGVLSLFSLSAANAAYAPPPFTADAPSSVTPGGDFTVTFSSGGVNCAWTSSFEGQTGAPGAGTSYSATFTAPTAPGSYTVTANCTWDPAVTAPALAPISSGNSVTATIAKADTLLAAPQTDVYTVAITVGGGTTGGDDDEADSNGALPNTGGESLTYLAIGAGLLVVGVGVTVAARRRTA